MYCAGDLVNGQVAVKKIGYKRYDRAQKNCDTGVSQPLYLP